MILSGIYKITNSTNKDFYIGSTNNWKHRKAQHVCQLRKNKHPNKHLQNSFNKNGENSFEFDLICEVLEDYLIEREQYFIDTLKPAYNKRKIADSNFGNKAWNKGGYDAKTLEKLRNKFSKKILCYNLNGEYLKTFPSITQAKIELNSSSVILNCQGKVKRCGDFMLRYWIENFPLNIEPYDSKYIFNKIRTLPIVNSKSVALVNHNNEPLFTYKTMAEAVLKNNISSHQTLRRMILNERDYNGNKFVFINK